MTSVTSSSPGPADEKSWEPSSRSGRFPGLADGSPAQGPHLRRALALWAAATRPIAAISSRTAFSETTTGEEGSPSARPRQPTGSPSPRRRSAQADRYPNRPPERSKGSRMRPRSGPRRSGLESPAPWEW